MLAVLMAAMLQVAAPTDAPQAPAPAPALSPERALALSKIRQPDWLRRPNAKMMLAAYPKAARKAGLVGKVDLNCRVTAEGTLKDCTTLNEMPADQGFGTAALKLTKIFRMRPTDPDGRSVEGNTVRIPLRFDVDAFR